MIPQSSAISQDPSLDLEILLTPRFLGMRDPKMEIEFAVTAPRSLKKEKCDIDGLGLGLNLQRGEVVATMLNRRSHERKGSRSMDPVG